MCAEKLELLVVRALLFLMVWISISMESAERRYVLVRGEELRNTSRVEKGGCHLRILIMVDFKMHCGRRWAKDKVERI